MFKTIIFDFFDVIRTDPYKWWLIRRGLVREGGYLEASQKMDRGELDIQGFFVRLSELTGESVHEIEQEMESITKMNYDVLSLIDELRAQKYHIGLLSNAPSEFIRDIFKQHDLEKYFDTIVISSEVGLIKPEPEIFHHILKQMNVSAGEAVFIDDNPHNVDAAEKVGIRGLVFTSAQTLQVDLNEFGIRTGENQWTSEPLST
jgi:putative hydrolase of the HAD superfamily